VYWYRAALVVLLGLVLALSAVVKADAHRPYWGPEWGPTVSYEVVLPNGQTATLKVLSGDGIFVADPEKAIVINNEGRVLAASPESRLLHAHCPSKRSDVARCTVFDALEGRLYTPDPTAFVAGILLAPNGEPNAYPDSVDSIGFKLKELDLIEYLNLEVANNLKSVLISVTGYTLIILLFTFIFVFQISIIQDKRKVRRYYRRTVVTFLTIIFILNLYSIWAMDATEAKVLFEMASAAILSKAILETALLLYSSLSSGKGPKPASGRSASL
jgi:hypothetical protein